MIRYVVFAVLDIGSLRQEWFLDSVQELPARKIRQLFDKAQQNTNFKQARTMSSASRVRNWELAGMAVIFFAGSAWHFVFEWSGHWKPIAWLAPINESVWEHFKMAFWPGLIWAGVAYVVVGKTVKNYWLGRVCGLWCMPVIIAVISYSYTTALGTRYLWVDILSFLIAIAIGQLVSYKLFFVAERGVHARWLGVLGVVGTILVFVLFTYMPPHIFIFEHVPTHEYGILADY